MRNHRMHRNVVKGAVLGGLLAVCLAIHAGLVVAALQLRDVILPALPWLATLVIVAIIYRDTRSTLRELGSQRGRLARRT